MPGSSLAPAFVAVPAAADNQPQPPVQRRPLGIADHWMMGYLPGTDKMFQKPGLGYATNLGIGSDGRGSYTVHEYVPVDRVAWGSGHAFINRVAVSIEHENDRAGGPTSRPTDETHEMSARVHAELALRFDWRVDGVVQLVYHDEPGRYYKDLPVPGFGVDFNVITHRSVYTTECPGKLDVPAIVVRANQLIRETTTEETAVELYVKAPNNAIIHFLPGVRGEYPTLEDYQAYRGDVNFIRARKGTTLISPPAPEDVTPISWEQYKRFCRLFGVPEK